MNEENTETHDDNEDVKKKPVPYKISKKYFFIGVIALISIGLAICLPVGLIRNNNTNQSQDVGSPKNGSSTKIDVLMRDGIIVSGPHHQFPFSLKSFDASSVKPYETCSALREDLKSVASLMLEGAILMHSKTGGPNFNDPMPREPVFGNPEIDTPTNVGANPGGTAPDNSYETNNQVKGVDEADFVKANEDYVFAVYGSEIITWNATSGQVLSRTQHSVPPSTSTSAQSAAMMPVPNVQVRSLLLHEDRLTAIVARNSATGITTGQDFMSPTTSQPNCEVHVYNIQNIPTDGSELQHVFAKNITGTFIESRSIGKYAHIVTTADTSSYTLRDATRKSNPEFQGLDSNAYLTKVKSVIEEKKVIENFVNQTMALVTNGSNDCTHVAQFSLSLSSDSDATMPIGFFEGGAMGAYGQITTIDMTASDDSTSTNNSGRGLRRRLDSTTDNNGDVTGFFLPNPYSTRIYASHDHIVLATPGELFAENNSTWLQYTFFRTFSLFNNGTRAQGKSIGKAPGTVLNQFSIDEWDGHLRVATTVRRATTCVRSNQPSSPVDSRPGTGGPPTGGSQPGTGGPPTGGSRPGTGGPPTGGSTTGRPQREGGQQNRRRTKGSVSTAGCSWQPTEMSDNMITILNMTASSSSNHEMDEVGSIKGLGLPGERIYSVRFMEEKAFMVTFRLTDPFYTFDLTNHSNPKMMGELKISGFSNYLHPYDSEGNVMIAVGQNADETTGQTTGLQISLFNVTDLTNATLIDRHDVQEDSSGYSWSDAQYDHKAFRFYEHSNKLIIPASVSGSNYSSTFDGFKVYQVSLNGISFHFDIQHHMDFHCWSNAILAARSLIHSGILTTMKGHTIKAHDIETKEFKWLTNLDADNTSC